MFFQRIQKKVLKMRYPKLNKKLVVVVSEKEKKQLIEASKKSYRTITSIAREGAMLITNKILTEKNATRSN